MMDEPIFTSTHDALKFMFRYAFHQSPKNSWKDLGKNYEDYYYIGKGRGLVGSDAAAQAGMIAAKLKRLEKDQIRVIVARYYTELSECPTCEQDAPPKDWMRAIKKLADCVELEGVHYKLRVKIIKRLFGVGENLKIDVLAKRYSLSERALYRQQEFLKKKFDKLFEDGMINIDNLLRQDPLLVA